MFRQPSIYEAQATIRIEQRTKNVLQTRDFVLNAQPDANFWGTQIKLLQSPALARQVALSLDLQHNPTFFGSQSQGGVFTGTEKNGDRRQEASQGTCGCFQAGSKSSGKDELRDDPLTPEELAALEPYEDAIIGSERVEGIVGTNLFIIKYRHTDPEMAQKVANALADVFRANNVERTTQNSTNAEHLLAREIAAFRKRSDSTQERLFNYAREKGLPPTMDKALNFEAQRLADLSRQILEAEKLRKNAQAIYASAKNSSDPLFHPGGAEIGPYHQPPGKNLGPARKRKRLSRLTYTNEWPEVKKAEPGNQSSRGELEKAIAEAINSLKAQMEAAQAHEDSIRQMYVKQRGTVDHADSRSDRDG